MSMIFGLLRISVTNASPDFAFAWPTGTKRESSPIRPPRDAARREETEPEGRSGRRDWTRTTSADAESRSTPLDNSSTDDGDDG